jgi:hypothetical protein
MTLIFETIVVLVLAGAGQLPQPPRRPLPVYEVEACRLGVRPLAANTKWGGRIAEYIARVNEKGAITELSEVSTPYNLLHIVRPEDLTSCLKKWRFGRTGEFSIIWSGGEVYGEWIIDVIKGGEAFRLRIPYP